MQLRCFFAIELPAAHLDALGDARHSVIETDPSWMGEKWVARDSIHITLTFMPDVPEDAVPGLLADTAAALADVERFDLRLAGLRAVPAPRRSRMLWVVFEDGGEATALASACRGAAAPYLDPAEPTRPFIPHATLCRARRPHSVDPGALSRAWDLLEESLLPPVSVSRVTLFSSTLGPSGPTYRTLHRLTFGQD